MNKLLLLAIGLFCFSATFIAQNTSDIVVPITVTTTTSPPSITLNFPATNNAVSTLIGRKLINQTTWDFIVLPANETSFTDTNIIDGLGFEYIVLKQTSVAPTTRVGLVYAGIEVPATAYRGKMILVVDDQLANPLSMELDRLVQDLRGDGWQVIRQDIDVASSTVSSVKLLLSNIYNQDPDNTITTLLFGNIPVPYSGDINPDGVPNHQGAWPTDYYYGDMDEAAWTDTIVNTTSAARTANHNIIGDGKFDQSLTPTLPEMVVSRVDFSKLSDWDVSQVELYRRYLDKNHNFRTGTYKPDNQTIVDDNLGFFGGEAFAQNGWRNGNAMTGVGTVVEADFLADTEDQSFLFGYGCGNGNYSTIVDVANSDQLKNDSVNIVFSMLFGPESGDWDFETNPLLPSILASKGGALATTWAGRPNWHFHHMGLGEPILTSTFWVWLNSFLANPVYPPNLFDDQVHVGLLGDPTLRAHNIRPPESLTATAACEDVMLAWQASPDADLGYLIYRAASPDSVFQLIVNAPIGTTNYLDTMPLTGMNYYMVKSIRLETVPTGSYYNQSVGTATAIDINVNTLTAGATPTNISCNGNSDGAIDLLVSGGTMNFTFNWSNGVMTQNLTNLAADTYTVTVSDAQGCSTTTSATVTEPPAIELTPSVTNVLCFGETNGQIGLAITGGTPNYIFDWSDGSMNQNLTNVPAGTYTVTATDDNGCTKSSTEIVSEPAIIGLTLTPENVSCNGLSNGNISLDVLGGTPAFTYAWSNGSNTQNLSNVPAGTYTVTTTDDNGCTQTGSETITEPTAIETSTTVMDAGCAGATNGGIDLMVSGGATGYSFEWSDGSTEQNLTNVAAGTYTVTITDASSCTQTTSATVGQVTTLNAESTQTDVSCFGLADGTATVTASGGSPGYTYLWSNGETTASISNLPAGAYTVTVTDDAGCSRVGEVPITEPGQITFMFGSANVSCNGLSDGSVSLDIGGGTPGFTFDWSNGETSQNIENLAAGTYTVAATDANGCSATSSTTITEPPILTVGTQFVQTSCPDEVVIIGDVSTTVDGGTPDYTYLWSNGETTANLQSVPSGPYTVTVTDANGCTVEQANSVFVTFLPWSVNPIVSDASCNGDSDGAINLTVSGANGPNYTYQWSNGSTSQNISDLTANIYVVTITDQGGCTTTQAVFVNQPSPIAVGSISITDADCTNDYLGTVDLNLILGGNPPFTYLWSNGATDLLNANIPAGTYTITLTDSKGCTGTLETTVNLIPFSPAVPQITGTDTTCINTPQIFSLAGAFAQYVWLASGNGAITQGQGTAQVEVSWPNPGLQSLSVVVSNNEGCQDSTQLAVFADICVGTIEPKLPGVHIQPNPFGEWLSVQFDRPVVPGARLRLLDMQGRLIFEQSTLIELTRLETGDLPAGSYVLQIVENNKVGIWKVVRY